MTVINSADDSDLKVAKPHKTVSVPQKLKEAVTFCIFFFF